MAKRWHFLSGLPHMLLIIIVLLSLSLIGCAAFKSGGTTTGSTTGTVVSSDTEAGHVIVQLFSSPGFIYPPINGVPDWTLYGNGTLIFKSAAGAGLVQAQLSPDEVQHILDVIVNQNAFFASTQQFYGRIIPDTGSLLLSVSANGQEKEVRLGLEPASSSDQQTQHVFAIKHFLLNYHPTTVQPYTAPGAVLLVLAGQGSSAGTPSWPYAGISLAQVAAQECSFLRFGTNSTCSPQTDNNSGLFPIYGKRGQELLQQWQSGLYTQVSQSGKSYQIIVWPLMPDALTPREPSARGVRASGMSGQTII
jgi:hypothetical protein